jgi:hypothetical protein
MECSRPRSLPGIVALMLALLGLLALAGAAYGRAEVGTVQFPETTFTDTVDFTDTCLGPGATGTITGTEKPGPSHFTETGPPSLTVHFHGAVALDYRIDFADGRFILASSRFHFDGEGNLKPMQIIEKGVNQDEGTLYGPNGEPLGRVTIHEIFHLTWRDSNENHEADPGEITADVDHFRLTCP